MARDLPGSGFHDARAVRLLGAIESDPRAVEAYARLIRLWETRVGLGAPDFLRGRLESLAGRTDLPPLLRSWVLWYLAAAEERVGRLGSARQRLLLLGFPSDLRVVGPFENLGGRGRYEPYTPELEASVGTKPGQVYPAAGGPASWRSLVGLGSLGRVDLGPLFSRSEEVLCYLAVAFHLPEATDLALRIGSSDGVKALVDGQLVHSALVQRDAAFDQEAVAMRLEPGWHRLLLKVMQEQGAWTSYVRITATDGSPLPGLRYSVDEVRFSGELQAPASAPSHSKLVEPIALARSSLEASRAAGRVDDAARLADRVALLGFLEMRLGPGDRRDQEDVTLLQEAVALDEARAELRLWLGEALDQDENARREAYEAAQRLKPGWVPALSALSRYHHARSDTVRAWRADDALLAADPGNLQALLRRARRWASLGLPERSLALLKGLRRALPLNPAVLAALAFRQEAMGDLHGAREALLMALRFDHLRFDLRDSLLSMLEGQGDLPGVRRQLESIIEVWPFSLSVHLRLARVLAENGEPDQALARMQGLVQSFPEDPRLARALARRHRLAGNLPQAIEALGRALELRPQDSKLRRYLRRLGSEEESLEERFAIPLSEFRSIPPPPGSKEAGAFRPLLLRAVRIHPNGMCSTFTQVSLVVQDARRAKDFRVHRISYVPQEESVEILLAERISPDGRVHRPTRIQGSGPAGKRAGVYSDAVSRRIHFSDLEPGDLIQLRYRIDEKGSRNLYGDFFGDILNLQERIPRARVVYVLDAPRGRRIYSGGRGVGPPKQTEAEQRLVHRWEFSDLPALHVEAGMPGYPEVGRYLNVSTYGSWTDLARWYADLIRPQLTLDPGDQALVHRIVRGLSTERETIFALHSWVLRNTRYVGIEFGIHGFKPYRASRVLRRGYGDCKDRAALLISMLAELGIDARLALVRTLDRGRLLPEPATLWAFNHAIVYVPSQDLWLDATAEYAGIEELPHRDQGAMTLVLDHRTGQAELCETPVFPAAANHWHTMVEGRVQDDLSLIFTAREQVSGQGAAYVRRKYQDPSLRRSRLEKTLARRYPGLSVLEAEVEALDRLDLSPTLVFRARIPNFLQREGPARQQRVSTGPEGSADSDSLTGRSLVMPLALFPGRLSDFLAPTSVREHERVIDYPWTEEARVRIRLPEGLALERQPPGHRVSSPFGSFDLEVSAKEGSIEIQTSLEIGSRRISTKEYCEFRRFLLEIDRIEARKLCLKERGRVMEGGASR